MTNDPLPEMTMIKRCRLTLARRSLLGLAAGAVLALGCNQRPAPAADQAARSLTVPGETPRPAPAPVAPADPALKASLLAAMSGYEHIMTKDELDKMGSPAALTAALLAIHQDPAVHLAVRTNALANLRFYPSPIVKTAMEAALLGPDTPTSLRRSAVKAYGTSFGSEAVEVLAKMLANPEIHTRNVAAKTLAQIGGKEAGAALRQRLPNEREQLVKSTIEAGLRRL
jgi:hypothetical protein